MPLELQNPRVVESFDESSQLYSQIKRSVSGPGCVIAIRPQYGDHDKDLLPFLESFLPLAEELRKRAYQVVLLPSSEVPDSFRVQLNGIPLFTCPMERLVDLDFVDVFFTMDDVYPGQTRFPERAKVIALRHSFKWEAPGNTEPVHHYLELAWESTAVDYVVRSNDNAAHFPLDAWRGVVTDTFPPDLHLRSSNNLGVIPAGYLKLDMYIKACEQVREPDALLFAPTRMIADVLCKDFQLRYGAEILDALLTEFPDQNVIYRPYPSDRDSPEVKEIVERFKDNARFELDRSAQIGRTYARSMVLIGDMSHASFSFCFSRLAPFVACSFDTEAKLRMDRCGYYAHDIAELIMDIRDLANRRAQWSSIIEKFRGEVISHAGHTAVYLAENVQYVLSGERRPDWAYIPKLSQSGSDWQVQDYLNSAQSWARLGASRFTLPPAILGLNVALDKFSDIALIHALKAKLLLIAGSTDEKITRHDKTDDPMRSMKRAFRLSSTEAMLIDWSQAELVALIDSLLEHSSLDLKETP